MNIEAPASTSYAETGYGGDGYNVGGAFGLWPGIAGLGDDDEDGSVWDTIGKIAESAAGVVTTVYKSTQHPYVVPGTSTIYNPATQQFGTTSGVAAQQYGQAVQQAASSNTGLLLGIAAVGAVLLIAMKK